MNRSVILASVAIVGALLTGCTPESSTSDEKQRNQQEAILQEGTAAVGMPAIRNFRERRLLKDILELRDQEGLVTYTYVWSEMQGKLIFFCQSIGYGIPYATQFTNPERPLYDYADTTTVPQADPNGLFSPESAEGTWVMCKDPNGPNTRPVYVEPRVVVSQFRLPTG